MSLRDKMNGKGLVTTTNNGDGDKSNLSLRRPSAPAAIARPSDRAVKAIEKISGAFAPAPGSGNIRFIIDATGSRDAGWREAQAAQKKMFESVASVGLMSLRLMHFGGRTLSDHGWGKTSGEVSALMSKVECLSGMTQIVPALKACVDDKERPGGSIILVGDSFEEDAVEAEKLAHQLKEKNIKIFAFHEGYDPGAEAVFKKLSEITGGTFAKFGSDLPLKDLCEAVAVLTVGGKGALERLRGNAAQTLLLGGPSVK